MNLPHETVGETKTIQAHILGYPRMGAQRQLKWALEDYWSGKISQRQLVSEGQSFRRQNWLDQLDAGLPILTVGDFAWYDQVLNLSSILGVVPNRFIEDTHTHTNTMQQDLDTYFRMARGRSVNGEDTSACEMTKWFNTNYHYIVPELQKEQTFNVGCTSLIEEIEQAKALHKNVKPVLIGPLTYLWLSKVSHGDAQNNIEDKLQFLPELLKAYADLLHQVAQTGVEWIQIDEPILGLDLSQEWKTAFETTYNQLNNVNCNLLLTTYFSDLKENLTLACQLPTAGLHLDVVSGPEQLDRILDRLPPYKVLSLGVVNGRNIWRADLSALHERLLPIAKKLKERLWIASSCSLLHSPVDLDQEEKLSAEIKPWLAFAKQKLSEVSVLAQSLSASTFSKELNAEAVELFEYSKNAVQTRAQSKWVHNPNVLNDVSSISQKDLTRHGHYIKRQQIQQGLLKLPLFPTTTIGSFPQTVEIRQARLAFKQGKIVKTEYENAMQTEIRYAVEQQEKLELDVLVHGEAERNDMVEYFGEQLEGYIFSQYGWVQSYGSRCVKPPIIVGDISRKQAMTVKWSEYAQSLTSKPMKGMLTGPITMLCWSFTRDDISEETQAKQLGLALRQEVQDLEAAGIHIIQVDEPALREGLPLRQADWAGYLRWAVDAFRLTVGSVKDSTQIHTHMCYAEFNDIIEAIAELDADVITIETSRSNMELLQAFDKFEYPNEMGPGVYDIHSPILPSQEWMVALLEKAALSIPAQRLWVNPDCGLKTRSWQQCHDALSLMVAAAKELREKYKDENQELSA